MDMPIETKLAVRRGRRGRLPGWAPDPSVLLLAGGFVGPHVCSGW